MTAPASSPTRKTRPAPISTPALDAVVVVFNGADEERSIQIRSAEGFALHSMLGESADETVQAASFSAPEAMDDGGTFTVPALTTAVFVKAQGAAQGMGLSAFVTAGFEPPVPYGDTQIYLRGQFNGWGTGNELAYIGRRQLRGVHDAGSWRLPVQGGVLRLGNGEPGRGQRRCRHGRRGYALPRLHAGRGHEPHAHGGRERRIPHRFGRPRQRLPDSHRAQRPSAASTGIHSRQPERLGYGRSVAVRWPRRLPGIHHLGSGRSPVQGGFRGLEHGGYERCRRFHSSVAERRFGLERPAQPEPHHHHSRRWRLSVHALRWRLRQHGRRPKRRHAVGGRGRTLRRHGIPARRVQQLGHGHSVRVRRRRAVSGGHRTRRGELRVQDRKRKIGAR